jgi:hypothetical protein
MHGQDCLQYQIAHNVESLYKQQGNEYMQKSTKTNRENKTKQIKGQLKKNNNAIITKADKGNCIVILCQNDYHAKVTDFLENNNFDIETIDPTNTFQKEIRNSINLYQLIIPKDTVEIHQSEPQSPQ